MAEETYKKVELAVASALLNALDNGHTFDGWSDEQIADDMMSCDADIENMPRDQVVAAVNGLRS